MHATDVSRAVATGLRFRPLEETIGGAADAPAEEGVGLTPEREAELLDRMARPMRVAYPGRGAPTAQRRARSLPGRGGGGAAVVLRRRRGRRLGPRRRRACSRSRARSPARSPRRTTCSSTPQPRSTLRRSSRSGTSSSASPTSRWPRSGSSARTRSRSTSAGPARLATRSFRRSRRADRRRGGAGGTRRRPTEVAIASERRRRCTARRPAADVGDHPRRPPASSRSRTGRSSGRARLADRLLVPDRPPAWGAPPCDRALRRHALDLVQLTSRPIPQTPWRYRFDAVVGATRSTRSSARPRRGPKPCAALHRLRLLPGMRELSEKLGAKPGRTSSSTSRRAARARAPLRVPQGTLAPADGLWIAWPKKASKLETDLDFDAVQQTGSHTGLVDNKSCAIDERWQALRFVYRLADRPQE